MWRNIGSTKRLLVRGRKHAPLLVQRVEGGMLRVLAFHRHQSSREIFTPRISNDPVFQPNTITGGCDYSLALNFGQYWVAFILTAVVLLLPATCLKLWRPVARKEIQVAIRNHIHRTKPNVIRKVWFAADDDGEEQRRLSGVAEEEESSRRDRGNPNARGQGAVTEDDDEEEEDSSRTGERTGLEIRPPDFYTTDMHKDHVCGVGMALYYNWLVFLGVWGFLCAAVLYSVKIESDYSFLTQEIHQCPRLSEEVGVYQGQIKLLSTVRGGRRALDEEDLVCNSLLSTR